MADYIPYGEASASLGRIMGALRELESRTEGPDGEAAADAMAEVRQWQIDLRNSKVGPSELPGIIGSYAATISDSRVQRILIEEKTVLNAMSSQYGRKSWYGNDN